MCSQNAKKGDKGNFNWEQGSMLFKVLKRFSLGKNHLLYLFKKSPHSSPHISTSSLVFFLTKEMCLKECFCQAPFSGAMCRDCWHLVLFLRCSISEQKCRMLHFLLFVSSYSPPHISIYDMHNHIYERLSSFSR